MPRKSPHGKYILSAGEIGSYTLCPEAWRLSRVAAKKKIVDKSESSRGMKLHDSWAQGHDEVRFLMLGVKIVVGLAVALLVWQEFTK